MSKYLLKPKFIHNLWNTYKNSDNTYLIYSKGYYQVPKEEAELFLKFRPYCTGHHDIKTISEKSGVNEEKIQSFVTSLNGIGLIRLDEHPLDQLTNEEIYDKLLVACNLWRDQLHGTHIFNEILSGSHTEKTFIGWLLETYHYVKYFPKILDNAYTVAYESDKLELSEAIREYADQERGHESFILKSLLEAGLTKEEVESSLPLVSTQAILHLMNNLAYNCPCSVFLISQIIESSTADDAKGISEKISKLYDLPLGILDGVLEHSKIDFDLEHYKLLDRYKSLIVFDDNRVVNNLLNALHDIKHSYDLQKLEIVDYYNHLGNYFPRQRVDFFGV